MENSKNNAFLIPLAIVVAGVMVSGAIYFGAGSKSNVATVAKVAEETADNVPKATTKDHLRGDLNAPIVVIEYSDPECPFCKAFHTTMQTVLEDYGGKVAWVYRHFPIAQLHSRAHKESEAMECAAELGGKDGFWNFTDEIFKRTNSNDSLDPLELPRIAADIGLDVTKFNSCLSSGKYKKFIDDQIEAAVKAGARGTPYSVVIAKDGKRTAINGAEKLPSVKAKIDALLK